MMMAAALTVPPSVPWQRQAASTGCAAAATTAPLPRSRFTSRRRSSIAAAPPGAAGQPTPQQRDAASLDVSGAVVQPAYRSTPWQEPAGSSAAGPRAAARVALVSESGICRGPLAAAAVAAALASRGLAEVECECRATQSYCVGEGAHPAAAAVAEELGLQLEAGYAAQQFKEARDIVEFDVVLVVDKFTAADVLREVSVFDTIKSWGLGPTYSSKVRRLGEFNPAATAAAAATNPEAGDIEDPLYGERTSVFEHSSLQCCFQVKDREAGDIEDPLYGNVGGEEELAAVWAAAADIQAAAEGFAAFVAGVAQQHAEQQAQQAQQGDSQAPGGEAGSGGSANDSSGSGGSGGSSGGGSGAGTDRLGDALVAAVRGMEAMEWMVPPMLQPR
ncbi:tyrosine phosphatase [Chlorella sorokiniana]|uniref:protein-tyrosine-phosphatase n=1 Tax=Chlorella sorokiniana TaxID=3076 RepID=A0A2P6U1K0_CHLSO|nr:tyrosine phosphatase [Chlorella sorokiniana]|eukprot:PRW60191.1 tyrosine phosphatase [Chlorella sorokiniana]